MDNEDILKYPSGVVRGGILNYPLAAYVYGKNCTFDFQDQSKQRYHHVVFGHSQLRDKWNIKLDGELRKS